MAFRRESHSHGILKGGGKLLRSAPDRTVYGFSARALDGRMTSLREFAGRVLLIVNTASRCGFTPQYAGLQALWTDYRGRGLTVLGFPCNQFGGQEPGDAGQIAAFCTSRFGVSFPVFEKVDVNGPTAHPLFSFLKRERPGLLGFERIGWNFTKFLVNRRGRVAARFKPAVRPQQLSGAVELLLDGAETI